jgi:cellobiose phosphorylase
MKGLSPMTKCQAVPDRNEPSGYFTFNDPDKELIIKRYDTPTPWMNYLSNGSFHTMISQAGGALAFYKSPQIWRINRYRFFHLPSDRSGVYLYIQDKETGEYWSPTAEPCQQKPDSWTAAHGLGYTRFEASRKGIDATLTYFVGAEADALVGHLQLTNSTGIPRKLTVYAYVEFGMMEFLREMSWYCYNKHQLSVSYDEASSSLIYDYDVEMQPRPEDTPRIYFCSDQPLVGYDGDRDEFIGSYRSEMNPYAIENGGCSGSTLKGGDPCGALQTELHLEAGQTLELNTFLGAARDHNEVRESVAACRSPEFVERNFKGLKDHWEQYISAFQCEIPDPDASRQVNTWNPYQLQRNFLFSRNISYYATGTFRGVGFRDSSQDAIAQASFCTQQTREKLKLLFAQQYNDGHVNHYFFPEERYEPVKRLHSDNHIWPILAVHQLIVEEGHLDFLHQEIPYFEGGKGTVYEHLQRSVQFSQENMGPSGFPLMLTSDWNDMLYKVCREGRGESIWMAMFLGYALPKFSEIARLLDDNGYANTLLAFWKKLKMTINDKAWDGRWFRRAIMDNGEYIGSDSMDEAKIWLNAQSWSVLSGMVEEERSIEAMDSVAELLDTPLGIKMIWPPIVNYPTPEDPLSHYNPGCGENGSVFCHANTWAIIAECMLKRPDKAWKYYRQLIPSVAQQRAGAWRYKAEPHVYASNLFGPESDKFGLANVSWLTGTASWMYLAVTQHILGVRPSWDGLVVDPCLPTDWKQVRVMRRFRGTIYDISIKQSNGPCSGLPKLSIDGEGIEGTLIPVVKDRDHVEVEVQLT